MNQAVEELAVTRLKNRIEELEKEVEELKSELERRGKQLGDVSTECGRRRNELRRVEAERDRLHAISRSLERTLVDLYVGPLLVDVDPFWQEARGKTFVDDGGRLDTRAVDATWRDLLARKPYLARRDTP